MSTDRREAELADAMNDGEVMLKFKPAQLLMALAHHCYLYDYSDAVRELLRPLFSEKQSALLAELHASIQDDQGAQNVAIDALKADTHHMTGMRRAA